MDADLAHPANSLANVTNDGTAANNTSYIKLGASGAGSWQVSSTSPQAVLRTYIDGLLDTSYLPRSGYLWAVTDVAGRISFGVDISGAVVIPGLGAIKPAVQTLQSYQSEGSNRSGYVWAVTDSSNKIAIGIDGAGNFLIGGIKFSRSEMLAILALQDYQYEWSNRSGYSWAVADGSGRVAIGLDNAGNFIVNGAKLDLSAINKVAADSMLQSNITTWGDSLTGSSYPSMLATLTGAGRVVNNKGVGGDNSTHIAFRMGAIPSLMTISNNSIPASGSVAVTPENNKIIQSGGRVIGYINGISGVLINTAGSYNFTRSNSGAAVTINPNDSTVVFNAALDDIGKNISVFWPGQNDGRANSYNLVVMKNLAAMVARLNSTGKKFVVMSVLGANAGSIGGAGYNSLMELNNFIRDAYPDNYINIRSTLITKYDSAVAQDVIDYNNDIVPSSLRADAVHLNTAGYQIVANAVFNFINQKGW